MFNASLLEASEYAELHSHSKSKAIQHDSFSSGSDQDDFVNHRSCHHQNKRKGCPRRAISPDYAVTFDQKAKAGIFVVDPFHCRINVEFLKAFAEHHTTQPLFMAGQQGGTYFSSSSDEDEIPSTELVPDMSFMGFTTGSSSEDDHCYSGNFDALDPNTIKPTSSSKKSPKNVFGSSKKSKSSSSSFSGVNSSKIVSSSSLPLAADNSSKFPHNLTEEEIKKLSAKVNSNYKSYPQNHRHGSTPMDISSCPGVFLLTEDEFIACSLLRIRPALYFHARRTLLHNFHHSVGYFRKSAAQKMLRIDVNKTGKLYDFLVRQNWIPEFEGGECRPEPEQIVVDDPETYHQL